MKIFSSQTSEFSLMHLSEFTHLDGFFSGHLFRDVSEPLHLKGAEKGRNFFSYKYIIIPEILQNSI